MSDSRMRSINFLFAPWLICSLLKFTKKIPVNTELSMTYIWMTGVLLSVFRTESTLLMESQPRVAAMKSAYAPII